MNKEAIQLIEQLAAKLGTTSEYMWAVLIRQAPISGISTLVQFSILIIGNIALYQAHKYFSNDDNKYSYYESDNSGILIIILFVVFAILDFIAFMCVGDVINAFLNPEFWALDYILNKLK